jgi:predicted MPP superfamily phosphohydrolase
VSRRTHVTPGAAALAAAAAAGGAWGWFEAGWVRLVTRRVSLRGLLPELDGLRIVHLSDFHLGLPSRAERAVRRAVEWAAAREPDLVVVTGDLVARPRGEPILRELLRPLERCYAILGNHDLAISRDPFSEPVYLHNLEPATLLLDEGRMLDVRGKRVWIAGLDPRSRWREPDLSGEADLRILLSHFPNVIERLPDGAFDLVLAGHMHDGQICLPYPGGKLRLAHLTARHTYGLYRRGTTTMHVSAGLGTTFLPFRFFARPEATELELTLEST